MRANEFTSKRLSPGQWTVDAILDVVPVATEIWFHGSRAIGKHKRTSDTDILVVVPSDITGENYLKILRILQNLSKKYKDYDIQPAHPNNNIHRIAQEEGKLLYKKQDINEGVNDPAIFKVVFVIGGPGSGKSYVSRELGLNAMGFVTVNSDVAFEYLMGKHGIDPKMPPEEKEKRDTVRARAKEITGKKSDLAIEGRLGIHIDGTGDDYDKVANLKKNFDKLGYDCYLVVVNTRLEVARQRNQMRARTVPDKIVTNSWYDVQDNIGRFANIFSLMSIIDNSGDAKNTDQQITKVHSRLQQFADSKPTKPAAQQWIANQKKVNEKWSQKYKRSIDCSHPKGFSQRAHCQGRKKH